MDQEPLVEDQIVEGRKFVELLDQAEDQPAVAFWLYMESFEAWRLVIGYRGTDVRTNPQKYFLMIAEQFEKMENTSLNIGEIRLTDLEDELVQVLASVITTGPTLSNIRFKDNYINGIFIQDAYIYRIDL